MFIEKGALGKVIVRYFGDEDYIENTTPEERMADAIQAFNAKHFACSTSGFEYPDIFDNYESFCAYVRGLCEEAKCEYVEPIVIWRNR